MKSQSGMMRYYCDKRSILSFLFFLNKTHLADEFKILNLVDQVYILWGQESTLDLAKIKAWSYDKNIRTNSTRKS